MSRISADGNVCGRAFCRAFMEKGNFHILMSIAYLQKISSVWKKNVLILTEKTGNMSSDKAKYTWPGDLNESLTYHHRF
jgi:hypothetical protein